jgi:hypothetical protein
LAGFNQTSFGGAVKAAGALLALRVLLLCAAG